MTTTAAIANHLVGTHIEFGNGFRGEGKGILRGQPRELSVTADSGEDSGEG